MKDLPEHELLSAYLDGELPADERVRVEQLLATNPAARQQLDEMRALSSTLHSLPVQKLNEDLSDRVLRLAERRMLSGTSPAVSPEPLAQSPEPGLDWKSIGQGLRRPRTWLWPAIALAVGLLLWVRSPEAPNPPAGRQVATARKATPPAEAPSIQAAPSAAPASPAPPAPEPLADAEGRTAGERDLSRPAQAEASADRRMADKLAAEAPAKAPALSAPKKESAGTELKFGAESAPAAASPPPASMAKRPPVAASQPTPMDRPGAIPPEPRVSKGAPRAFKAKAADKADADLPPLLVRCDVTPQALKDRVFETLLPDEQLRRTDANRSKDRTRQESKVATTNAASGRELDQSQEKQEKEQSASPGVSYVEFTATRGELLTLLARLKARPDLFVSVPEPSQLGLIATGGKAAGPAPGMDSGMGGGQEIRQQFQATAGPAKQTKAEAAQPGDGESQKLVPQAIGQQAQSQAGQQIAGSGSDAVGPAGPTYYVRMELRVVANAAAAEPAKPAAPSAGKP